MGSQVISMKIATYGEKGSFSERAAVKFNPRAELTLCGSMGHVYNLVLSKEVDVGVFPYYNTSSGIVDDAREIFDFSVNGSSIIINDKKIEKLEEIKLPISQSLLGLKQASLEDILLIMTHNQAKKQCSEFIGRLPKAEVVTSYNENGKEIKYSTSFAAKTVSEEGSIKLGAICSADLVNQYPNLKVIAENIQNSKENCTYFVAFKKSGLQ